MSKDDDKWVNMRQEKIEFDGKMCLLLSLRDVSSSHILQKTKQEVELLRKLHLTILHDLVDPLSLIHVSAAWLVKYHQMLKKKNEESFQTGGRSTEAFENMFNILVASKMSLFKCKDLMEIATDGDVPH